jgi:1-acyl-sn-glycerol-3-phosphate acyltransferase
MNGFITKSEFTGPGMTQLAPALGLLFISRDTKIVEERKNMIETIRTRQILAEEGKQNPLTIFPEGGTTNGEYIIKFKKGAFVTLRAV